MTNSDKQRLATRIMSVVTALILFSIILICVVLFMPKHSKAPVVAPEHVSAQSRNLNKRWDKMQHQDFITFEQFGNVFEQAKVIKDDSLIKQMNLTHIVDDSNGHVYCVNINKKNKQYSYTLKPVQDDNGNMVNPYWLDRHTK